MSYDKTHPRTGTWAVLVILLLGLIGTAASYLYWRGVVRRTFPTTQPIEGAGAAPWDPKAARVEYEELRARFDETAGKGDLSPLLKDARRLVERYPRYAEARTLLAQALLFQGQIKPAYDQLLMSLQIDKQQADVQFTAGTLAAQLGDTLAAARHYSMAVDLAPKQSRYRVFLANSYLKLKETDRARAALLEALNTDSTLHEAYALLSEIYAQDGKADLAIDQIQKAIDHTPAKDRPIQVQYILRKAALLRRDNRPEDALQVLGTLTAKERSDPGVLQDTATSWAMLGRFDQAAAVYEKAMESDLYNWRLPAEAARWRIKAGDKAGAKKDIEAVRRINPKLDAIGELEKELK